MRKKVAAEAYLIKKSSRPVSMKMHLSVHVAAL